MNEARRFQLAPQHAAFAARMNEINQRFDNVTVPLLKELKGRQIKGSVRILERARLAEKLKVAEELERKEQSDPLRHIGRVLKSASETDEEQAYMDQVIARNEVMRGGWRGYLKTEPNIRANLEAVQRSSRSLFVHEDKTGLSARFWIFPQELEERSPELMTRVLRQFDVDPSSGVSEPDTESLRVKTNIEGVDFLINQDRHTVYALFSPEPLLKITQY